MPETETPSLREQALDLLDRGIGAANNGDYAAASAFAQLATACCDIAFNNMMHGTSDREAFAIRLLARYDEKKKRGFVKENTSSDSDSTDDSAENQGETSRD